MKSQLKRIAKDIDYPLLIVYVFLLLFGLVMVYSSSMDKAISNDKPYDFYYNRQRMSMLVAFFAFTVASIIPYRHYVKPAFIKVGIVIVAIMYVQLKFSGAGADIGGQRWIKFLGIIQFQPSEFLKFFIVLTLASVLGAREQRLGRLELSHVIGALVPVVIGAGLIISEPDIGTAVIYLAISYCIFLSVRWKPKDFKRLALGTISVIGAGAVFLLLGGGQLLLSGNREGRLNSFLDPFMYAQGEGMQVVQSYLAFATGGLTGQGIGQSVQKLGYLPEPHTDFIIAIIAEELGLVGIFIVLGGLGYLVLHALMLANRATNPKERFLAVGVASWIGLQTFVNVGGATGIIPLTGVTLPLLSFGGVSLLMVSASLGIVMNISIKQKMERRRRKELAEQQS